MKIRAKTVGLFSVIWFTLFALAPQIVEAQPDTTIKSTPHKTYDTWNSVEGLYKLIPARDTFKLSVRDTGAVAYKNGCFYYWNNRNVIQKLKWDTLSAGGGGAGAPAFDTTVLNLEARLQMRLLKSDTSGMLLSYLTRIQDLEDTVAAHLEVLQGGIRFGVANRDTGLNIMFVSADGDSIVARTFADGRYVKFDTLPGGAVVAIFDTARLRADMNLGAAGGTGNTNSNIGSQYRWAIPGTNNIKTFGITTGSASEFTLDSTTFTNALALGLDTTRHHTFNYNEGRYALRASAVYNTRNLTVNGVTFDLSADRTFTVTDASISTSDITTNNVSTSKHGFAPKAPNDAAKFLDGTGAWTVPPGSGGGGANRVRRDNDTVRYTNGVDTTVYVEPKALGIIYNANSWTSGTLASDWNVNGITASVVSTKIQVSGGAGTYDKTLDLDFGTLLESFKFTVKFKVGTQDGSSYGVGIGTRSLNTFGASDWMARITNYTGNIGQLLLDVGTSHTNVATSATNLSMSANDYIIFTYERRIDKVTVTVQNVTTGSAPLSIEYTAGLPGTPYLPNTGTFSVFSTGGTFTIDSVSVTSREVVGAPLMIIGDSKAQGYVTTSFNNRYGYLLGKIFTPTIIHAGGFDRTTEVLLRLNEIISLKPRQIILAIGSNDKRSGTSSSTYLANYDTIVNRLTRGIPGVKIFHSMQYESDQNQNEMLAHLASLYPTTTLNTYYPTQYTDGDIADDGIHLTNQGNQHEADIIFESGLLYGSNRFSDYSANATESGSILNQNDAPQHAAFWIDSIAKFGTGRFTDVNLNIKTGPDQRLTAYAFTDGENYFNSLNDALNGNKPLNVLGGPEVRIGTSNGGLPDRYIEINSQGYEVSVHGTYGGSAADSLKLVDVKFLKLYVQAFRDTLTTGSSAAWGSITGTLSSQSDLNTALGLKSPLASPTFTGTPTAPTASTSTNTTQIATTAFVQANKSWNVLNAQSSFTSGGAVTISSVGQRRNYINPGSALTSCSFELPSGASDGDEIIIYFGGTVTSGNIVVPVSQLTITAAGGASIVQTTAPTSALSGDCLIYSYHSINTTWYRER